MWCEALGAPSTSKLAGLAPAARVTVTVHGYPGWSPTRDSPGNALSGCFLVPPGGR